MILRTIISIFFISIIIIIIMTVIQGANQPCQRRRRSPGLLCQARHPAQTNHRSGELNMIINIVVIMIINFAVIMIMIIMNEDWCALCLNTFLSILTILC